MALNFGGTSQYVEIPDSISLRLSGQCFMSSWVYINSFPASNKFSSIIVKKYDGSKVGYYLDIYNNSGTLKLRVGSYQTSKDIAAVWDITGWNTEEWNWISGGYDGSNWNLYFNEEMKSQTSQEGTGAISASLPVNLGCTNMNGTYDRFLNGMLFDTRIYNRYPSANEIAEIYHKRGADKVWQGLVGRWRLDELSSGTPAPILLDSMDSVTGWIVSPSDSITLNETTYKEGNGAINFIKATTARTYSYMYKTISSTNVTGQIIKLWIYIKDQTTLNKISHIHARLYSTYDTNGKYGGMLNADLIVGWNLFSMHINDFEDIGTTNITAITTLRVQVNTYNNSDTIGEGNVVFDFYRTGDYPFQVPDLSGNGNHGVPYNSPVYRDSPHRLRRGVLIA